MKSTARLSDENDVSDPSFLIFLCTSKDGQGGSFGAIIRSGSSRWAFGSRALGITPNAMELVGVRQTLDRIYDELGPSSIEVFVTDNTAKRYKTLHAWQLTDWAEGGFSQEIQERDVANAPHWRAVYSAVRRHLRVKLSTIPSGKKYWGSERKMAKAIAKTVGLDGYAWCDVSDAFQLRSNPSELFPNNDNN